MKELGQVLRELASDLVSMLICLALGVWLIFPRRNATV